MSMFIEVQSVEKGCPVIINLEHVIEVAPLAVGGCEIKMSDDGVSKSVIRVKDEYTQFKQFAMQTVSSDDIARRIEAIHQAAGTEVPDKPKRGRPAKVAFNIPTHSTSSTDE